MKLFYIPTAVSIGLICSYLTTGICHNKLKILNNTLVSMKKIDNYESIKNTRQRNFIVGVLIAIILSVLYWFYISENNLYHKIINTSVIILLIPMVVYMIIPKKNYFLDSVTTINETKQWFDIYKCMQRSMIYGFFIPFFLALLLLFIFDKKKN